MKRLRKIDIHVHTAKTPGMPRVNGETLATPEELIAMYDRLGIQMGTLLPAVNVEGAYDTQSNREIMEIVAAYPDRFAWFCNIDPRQGNNAPDTDFSRFIAYYRGLGARGVGEVTANLPFDHPLMLNLFRHCEACRMPVLFHLGNAGGDYGIVDVLGLPHLENALRACPELTIIGHSQKFWACISGDASLAEWNGYPKGPVTPGGRVVELMRRYPNLHGDLSAMSGYNALARDPAFAYQFLEEFQDRLFYGTDICAPTIIDKPPIRLAAFLDTAMEEGHISYAAYEKIARGNAEALLGLKG